MDDIFQPIPIYQPTVVAPTSVGTQVALLPRVKAERPTFTPDPRQCDVQQANGGEGSITFKDCDGAQTAKFSWKRGLIQEQGDQEVTAGCDSGPSSFF